MFYCDIEEEEFKGANGRDSQREHGRNDNHAPISFPFFFLNQKQLIQCNLPHSHTYLKCPRMNMAVIKSHSADEMKTVRRQRQKRGGGRGGGQETGLESHISTTALRLRHKLLFISIPAACHNYLSPLEGSPRGVGLFHGVEIRGRGRGPAGGKRNPVV